MARSAPVQVPGAEGAAPAQPTKDEASAVDPRDAELAELRAKLASKEAADKLPQVVFEPETPKGKLAREASDFAHLSVKELMAKIDAGEAKEPITSILCADGWYTRRS